MRFDPVRERARMDQQWRRLEEHADALALALITPACCRSRRQERLINEAARVAYLDLCLRKIERLNEEGA